MTLKFNILAITYLHIISDLVDVLMVNTINNKFMIPIYELEQFHGTVWKMNQVLI